MTSLSRVLALFVLLSSASSVACSAEVTPVPPAEVPGALPNVASEPPSEPPLAEAPRPAQVRIAHMWEQRDSLELCVLGEGDGGVGIRPTYRTLGAIRERTEGGIPRYNVGRFVRLEAGTRVLKLVGADAEDCSAPEIASATIRMEEGVSYTFALSGSDPALPTTQVLADRRSPEAGTESIRYYDFVNDTSLRSAEFETFKLPDYRQTPSDTTVPTFENGRITARANGQTVSVDHYTEENSLITVFATGTVATGTFRLLVCKDHDRRGQGFLSSCLER